MNSILVEKSPALQGEVNVSGAKNAVLVEIASLLLVEGVSTLDNVPFSQDVYIICKLIEDVGAKVIFHESIGRLVVDTTNLTGYKVSPEYMKKMRASILVLGPLLARFLKAEVALPGGCVLGARPIDFHIKNFQKMGVSFDFSGEYLIASCDALRPTRVILEYPSVGATENILMAAVLTDGETIIVNAALEPEVLDLVKLLKSAGADIEILAPATIKIVGVKNLKPVHHKVMYDRLEAGTFLIAAAVTGGSVFLPNVRADKLDVFLMKLEEMGHKIEADATGIKLTATLMPKAVSFKTSPYPGFPTDLQAPMLVAQCLAEGKSVIEETVFENRLLHCAELNKMGANIQVNGTTAIVNGVGWLNGSSVVGTDIRAAAALVIAGLVAKSGTTIFGLNHIKRGYDNFDVKLRALGANISYLDEPVRPEHVAKCKSI